MTILPVGSRPSHSHARLYDASPDGWHPDPANPPTRYRFVCVHKSRDLPNLNRPVRADALRELYDRAREAGTAIELRP